MGGRSRVLAEIGALDPETDFERILYLSASYDFPWDVEQSLSLAFFKTYGIPSISSLLDRTREMRVHSQKRYDDTKLILAEIFEHGMDSDRGREAVRRLNRMHGRYTISDDDYLYVLSTMVLEPLRWNDKFGWRRSTEKERRAALTYWRELGRRMNIREIPDDLATLDTWSRQYEAANLRFTQSSRRVAEDTMSLFLSWYPGPMRWLVRVAILALLEDPLLEAFGYAKPPGWIRWTVEFGLRMRARIEAMLPRRTKPRLVTHEPMRTYPRGYRLEDLGVTTSSSELRS